MFSKVEFNNVQSCDDLPTALSRLSVAVVASVALHLGLLQSLTNLPASKAAPGLPQRLMAHLLPLPESAINAPAAEIQALAPSPAAARAVPHDAAQPAPVSPLPAPAPQETGSRINLPAPRYYSSVELDDKPGLATAVTPLYPEQALRDKLAGRVVLRFLINETGGLDDLAVVEAEPAEVFSDSALAAFRNARFVPGKLGGADVKTQFYLELNYVPGETTTVRTESQMTHGISVQTMRQGPLPWPYRKPASARNLDAKK